MKVELFRTNHDNIIFTYKAFINDKEIGFIRQWNDGRFEVYYTGNQKLPNYLLMNQKISEGQDINQHLKFACMALKKYYRYDKIRYDDVFDLYYND